MDIHPPWRAGLAVAAVGLALSACSHVPGVYTIESRSDARAAGGQTFDPAAYVDEIWDSKVLPAVRDQATDAQTLLTAVDDDPDAAGERYGHRSGVGGAYSYLIEGSGTITDVDTDSASQPLTVRLDDAEHDEVSIVTGQVIAGTALRDAVGFISFSGFSNQLDYADVATQLNDRVRADVLQQLPDTGDDLVGRKVTFSGAFSSLVPGTVSVVPVTLEVGS